MPCPACLQEEDAAFERITAYLEAGGVATLAMVAQGTGIKTGLLRRLVKSGRVLLGDAGVASAVCAVCGRDLSDPNARLCAPCARRMGTAGRGRIPSGPPPQSRAGRGGFYSQHGGSGA